MGLDFVVIGVEFVVIGVEFVVMGVEFVVMGVGSVVMCLAGLDAGRHPNSSLGRQALGIEPAS
jgi:putative Mn2+ efflux pump MntP